jgi:hypothetical protein
MALATIPLDDEAVEHMHGVPARFVEAVEIHEKLACSSGVRSDEEGDAFAGRRFPPDSALGQDRGHARGYRVRGLAWGCVISNPATTSASGQTTHPHRRARRLRELERLLEVRSERANLFIAGGRPVPLIYSTTERFEDVLQVLSDGGRLHPSHVRLGMRERHLDAFSVVGPSATLAGSAERQLHLPMGTSS